MFGKKELEEKDKEIERLHSIIKEVREYIEENYPTSTINYQDDKHKLLEILGSFEELNKELEEKDKEIERLNNILDEIDLIFYRMRFVDFYSKKDEMKFLYENIFEVRKICQNKKLNELKVDEYKENQDDKN